VSGADCHTVLSGSTWPPGKIQNEPGSDTGNKFSGLRLAAQIYKTFDRTDELRRIHPETQTLHEGREGRKLVGRAEALTLRLL